MDRAPIWPYVLIAFVMGCIVADWTREERDCRPQARQKISYSAPVYTDYSEGDLAFARRMIK